MRYLKEEDLQTCSRFLFLSMAIIVMEQDIRSIEKGNFKIKEPYLELLRKMEHMARAERKQLQVIMRKRKLDVVFLQKNDTFSTYMFTGNGYEEEKRYFNPAVRKKVQGILYELMHRVLRPSRSPAANGTADAR
ncbi:hypothetical protein EDD68_13316 [Melghiribacillus thermohalophilus]|uniref:Uncharacterized protein n=1 Tax=Melghiribacillus thermohalophilus TaxID=1324956 RepID=A0A4V2V0K3_9BACI|nr:hypothetical protein [Melghiribacillus thermohalophilus]TCT16699.1 hypothetical protein EDD68_13316 [Melghiribacillus thermohalophilus]